MKRTTIFSLATVALAVFGLAVPQVSLAAWSGNPIHVAGTTDDERRPQVVYDGSGGYFVTWQSYEGGVYAKHFNSDGDATWDGALIISDTAESYAQQESTTDGNGGLLVSWQDSDDLTHVQRVRADGSIVWAAGGVAALEDGDTWIAADGTGGAIVMSYNSGTVNRVAADGSLPWAQPADAKAFSESWSETKIASDGAGGAVMVWYESSAFSGIAVQKVDNDGNFLWNDGDPVQLSSDGGCPRLIAVDGGAIVVWYDGYNVYTQKIDADGAIQWAAGGVGIETVNNPYYMGLATDGAGGVFVTWEEGYNIVMSQHVDGEGNIVWDEPLAMSTSSDVYDIPQHPRYTIDDGAGGFITVWSNDDYEIRAQRVTAAGELLWTGTGALLGTAEDVYYGPKIASNGQGGAVAVWVDDREDTGTDIFLQGVSADGVAGDPGYKPPLEKFSANSGGCFLETLGGAF